MHTCKDCIHLEYDDVELEWQCKLWEHEASDVEEPVVSCSCTWGEKDTVAYCKAKTLEANGWKVVPVFGYGKECADLFRNEKHIGCFECDQISAMIKILGAVEHGVS